MKIENVRGTSRDKLFASTPKKKRRRIRTKCRVCRAEQGKRYCQALKVVIGPNCCRRLRGTLEGEEGCFYYAPLIRRSRVLPQSEFPVYTCLATDSVLQGMVSAVIARKKPNGNLQAMFLLLDLWKKGIRDCFVDADLTEESLKEQVERRGEVPYKEIGFQEFQRLVRWAYEIARQVGTPIPESMRIWERMLGDYKKLPPPPGSLYKCAKCGGELENEVVELMKQYAQQDDLQFYILCRKCGGQFKD